MFSLPTLLLAAAAATAGTTGALAQNVEMRGYASAVGCTGGYFYNTNGGALCVAYPVGYRGSAQWVNLPAGSQGQGYTDGGCVDYAFEEFGPGTVCHATGGAGFHTLNWFHSPAKRAAAKRADEDVECVAPTGLVFTAADGSAKEVKVESKAHAQFLADLALAGNVTALEKLAQ